MAKLLTFDGQVINSTAYIYMRCRVKIWSKIWVFLSQNLVQGCVKTWSKICFCLFSHNFIVFFGYLKNTHIVCRGPKIFFWQFVRLSKKGFFSKKNVHFLFLSFMLEKEKRKHEKKLENEKKKKKRPEK